MTKERPAPDNPYIKKRETQKGPMIARLPQHYFKDGGEMERELYPYEACIAMMPNSRALGFEFHAAFVYKDGDGKVYSCGLTQHHAILKDTKENHDALQVKSSESVSGNQQTEGGEEIRSSRQHSGEESPKSGETEEPPKTNQPEG